MENKMSNKLQFSLLNRIAQLFVIACILFVFSNTAKAQLSGTINVGAGQTYTTLGAAAADYNTLGLAGNTTLVITSDLTETASVQFLDLAPNSTLYTLTITSDGTRHTVSGAINGPLLQFLGGNNIIIDGQQAASNTDVTVNKLVFYNTFVTTSSVVRALSIDSDGGYNGGNVRIRNTEFLLAQTTTSGTAAISISVDSVFVSGCYIHDANVGLLGTQSKFVQVTDNVIANNQINGINITPFNGATTLNISNNIIKDMVATGTSVKVTAINLVNSVSTGVWNIQNNRVDNINNQTTFENTTNAVTINTRAATTFSGNTITNITCNATSTGFALSGVSISGSMASLQVLNNTISNFNSESYAIGFFINNQGAPATGLIKGNTITNFNSKGVRPDYGNGIAIQAIGLLNIDANTITNIKNTVGSAIGIYIGNPYTGNITNNMISDIAGTVGMGIYAVGSANIYHNTIRLTSKLNDAHEATALNLGDRVGSISSVTRYANNILSNEISNGAAQNFVVKQQSGASLSNMASANNRYNLVNGTLAMSVTNKPAQTGTAYPTLASFAAATSDNSSMYTPSFLSISDLHLSASKLALQVPVISGVTTDFDGDPRSTCTNAAGADNFAILNNPLSGSYVVSTSPTADFNTLAEVANFYNSCGLAGNTRLIIASDLTETATSQFLRTAPNSTLYTLAITSDGTRRTVSGAVNGYLIRFVGANNIYIDGEESATEANPTAPLLAFINTYATPSGGLRVLSVEKDGANEGGNVRIRNAEFALTQQLTSGSAAVNFTNDSVFISGTYIHNAFTGFNTLSSKYARVLNNIIVGNQITGLSLQTATGATDIVVTGNVVKDMTIATGAASSVVGIQAIGSSVTGTWIVSNNKVNNIQRQLTSSASLDGIIVQTSASLQLNNNKVSNLLNNSTATGFALRGINLVTNASTTTLQVLNDTVQNLTSESYAVGMSLNHSFLPATAGLIKNCYFGNIISKGNRPDYFNSVGISFSGKVNIDANTITNIKNSVFSAIGIFTERNNISVISNNMVSDVAGKPGIGISVVGSADVFQNSVRLLNKQDDADEATALNLGDRTTNNYTSSLRLWNNILSNEISNGSASNFIIKKQPLGTLASMTRANNRYNLAAGNIGMDVTNAATQTGTVYPTLAGWATFSADNSTLYTPSFLSTSDLHIGSFLPGAQVPIATGVNVDFDGNVRTACNNAAGADNFTTAPTFVVSNVKVTLPVCLTDMVRVSFEASAGMAPFSYSLNGGSTYSVIPTIDSVTQAGNYAMHFSQAMLGGSYQILLKDANGCLFPLTSAFTVAPNSSASAPVTTSLYVKTLPAGSGNGSSWDNAFDGRLLAYYLKNIATTNTKIYVAAGTYIPYRQGCDDSTNTRQYAFEVKQNIKMQGGFSATATGTSLVSYNPKVNVTTLSGEIQADADDTNNSYHVVVINQNASPNLSGFYISHGYADNTGGDNTANGGGILDKGGNTVVSLSDLIVENNTAFYGAGIYFNSNDTTRMNRVVIQGNKGLINYGGAGIFAWGNFLLDNSTINNNINGAGIVSWGGDMLIRNSTIANNQGYGISADNSAFGDLIKVRIESSTIFANNNVGVRLANINNNTKIQVSFDNALVLNNTPNDIDFSGGNNVDTLVFKYTIIGNKRYGNDLYDVSALPKPVSIGVLADNGGWGQTNALLNTCDNPAVMTGNPALLSVSTTQYDERGVARTNPPSIGAYDGVSAILISFNTPPVTTICEGSPLNITATVSTPDGIPIQSYQWYKNNAAITGATSPTLNFAHIAPADAGSYVLVVATTDAACSRASDTLRVVVNPAPVPTIAGNFTICGGSEQTYTTESGMSGYVWTVAGGTITSGAGTNSITVTWGTTSAGSVTVNYSNASGCTSAVSLTTTQNVTINPLPTPTISGNDNVCAETQQYTYTTEAGMSNYVWSVLGGVIIEGGTSTDNTANVKWNDVGTGTISVNYTNANGCSAAMATQKPVNINPRPIPNINGNTSVCAGSAGNVYTTEAGMSFYEWTVMGGTITSGAGTNSITVTWGAAGNGIVNVNYTTPNFCEVIGYTGITVFINALPQPTLTGNATVCAGSSDIYVTEDIGASNYVWTVEGGTITNSNPSIARKVTIIWGAGPTGKVTVNYTNADGCTAAAPTEMNVSINSQPVPIITGNLNVCEFSTEVYTTEADMSNYRWTVNAGAILDGAGTNRVTVQWFFAGAGSIAVDYTNANGCSSTQSLTTSQNITINTLPNPTLTGNSVACASSTNTYTTESGMNNYVWSVTGGDIVSGGTSTDSTATVKWTAEGTGVISASYANANGCTTELYPTLTITITPTPNPTIIGDMNGEVCAGMVENYTTEPSMNNYQWAAFGGTIVGGGTANDNTLSVLWENEGGGYVTVKYTDFNGCTNDSVSFMMVNVNPAAQPTISGNTSVCAGSTNNIYTTETGMSNYEWTVTGGIITGGGTLDDNSVTVTWPTAGAGTVAVSYANEQGCSTSQATVANISVNPTPIPTVSGNTSVCAGSINNIYTTETGMTNYVWNVIGGTITAGASTNAITVTWGVAGAGTVEVNYTNNNGCTSALFLRTSRNITINPLPVPTLSGNTSVCFNSTGNAYVTDPNMTDYVWSVSGGVITSGGTATDNYVYVKWNVTGTGNVAVNYKNSNGCSATSSTIRPVTVNPLPTPSLNGNTTVCAGSMGNVYITESGKSNYQWSVIGGLITAGGGANDNTATITWGAAGSSRKVIVNYSNASGCVGFIPTEKFITVKASPLPTITGNTSVCANSTGNVYTTESGMSFYQWTVVGGTITAGGSTTNNSVMVTWGAAGVGEVRVNYYNSNGCQAGLPTIQPVNINITPNPTITGNTSVCANSTGNVYTTESGMTNYVWSVAGGTITAGGTATDNTVTITWGAAGAGVVNVNYTNTNGCSSNVAAVRSTQNITINPLPVPNLGGSSSVCVNSTGNVYTTDSGKSNYVWSVVGGTITAGGTATDNTATVTWAAAGTGYISVNYQNANGCEAPSAKIKSVVISALPTPTISGPLEACALSNANVYTTEAGMTNYQWTVTGGVITAGGSATNNSVSVRWGVGGTGKVTVNYTNANGCTASISAEKLVTIIPVVPPTIMGNGTSCVGSEGNMYTTETGMSNYVWTVTGGTITTGGTLTDSTATVTWTDEGIGQVRVNYTNADNCTALLPSIKLVDVGISPTPTVIGDTSVCAGSAGNVYTTEIGMTNYVWNVVGGVITAGGTITDNSVTVTWGAAGAGVVEVNYTDGHCVSLVASLRLTQNIHIHALPTPNIGGGIRACANSTSNVYTTEGGMSNYVWSVTGGTITAGGTATDNTVTVTWGAAGTGFISVNYNNANGCTALVSRVKAIFITNMPVPTIIGNSTVCAISQGNVYTTESGIGNYMWQVTGGIITAGGSTTDNTVTVTWGAAGTGRVAVSFANNNNCQSVVSEKLVTINALPTPTITGNATVCEGSTGNVYTTESGMTGYVWNVVGGTITAGGTSTNNTVTVTWGTTGVGRVSVNYSNAAGCSAILPHVKLISVGTSPNPTVTGNTSVCANSTGNVYTTESGMTNYVWTVAGGTITAGGTATDNSVTVTWGNAGTGVVTVNYSNAFCASAVTNLRTSQNISINALPQPTIIGSALACVGSTGNIYTTESGMTNYRWNVIGGTITAGGTTTDNTVTITWDSEGTKYVTVNYSNGNGCSASASAAYAVVVSALPVPTLSGVDEACSLSTGNVYTTESGMTGYVWTVTGGVITAGGNSTSSTATVQWLAAGVGTISVNYKNANGCNASTPVQKTVNIKSAMQPVINGNATACAGSTGNVYTTEAGMTNYVWSVTDGTITAGGTATNNTVTITWGAIGSGVIRVSYTDANGCASLSTTKEVSIGSVPQPTISGNMSVCANSAGNVYTTESGMTNYVWSITGGTITAGGTATNNSITITWGAAGTGTVAVNYTNTNGCISTLAALRTSRNVVINPLPTPSIIGNATACAGSTSNVYTTELGMSAYHWTVIGGTIASGDSTNAITVTWGTGTTGKVTVGYANANGCASANVTEKNVTLNALPVPTISGNVAACQGSTNNVYTTESGKLNYVWTVTGGIITAGGGATSNSVTVIWNTVGTGKVSVLYSNASGCGAISPANIDVAVTALPAPTISGNTSVCANSTGNVYTTESGKLNYVWTVTGGTITAGGTATDNSVTITWGGVGFGSVGVRYNNAQACTTPPTVKLIRVGLAPAPTITGSTTVCANTSGVVYTTETGMTNYAWIVNGGTIAAGQGTSSITVNWGAAGTGTVEVNYTNTNGCTILLAATNTVQNVAINPLPTPTIVGQSIASVRSSYPYYTESGNTNYVWTVTGGIIISGQGTSAITVEWVQAGTTNLSVSYSNAAGCSAVAPFVKPITVLNDDATLSDLAVDGTTVPGFSPNVFVYDVTIPTVTTNANITAIAADPNATLNGTGQQTLHPGNNTVTVTVTAQDGVTQQVYVINIHVYGIASSINIDDKSDVYTGEPIGIDSVTVVPSYLPIIVVYNGTDNDGVSYGPTAQSPTNAGIYTVTASTVGDSEYAPSSDVATLTIAKASQTITFNALPEKIVTDAPFPLAATASSGLAVRYVSSDPAVASVDATGIVTLHAAGTVSITAYQDGNGNYFAAASVTQTFTVFAKVIPAISLKLLPDRSTIVIGETVELMPVFTPDSTSNKTIVSYTSSNTNVATVQNTNNNGVVTGISKGVITVTAVAEDGGLTATAQVTVLEEQCVRVSEGFSPDGDGINDFFIVQCIEKHPINELYIYDKGGALHYYTVNYDNTWDGTANHGPYKGKRLPAGTYFYVLRFDDIPMMRSFVIIKY